MEGEDLIRQRLDVLEHRQDLFDQRQRKTEKDLLELVRDSLMFQKRLTERLAELVKSDG